MNLWTPPSPLPFGRGLAAGASALAAAVAFSAASPASALEAAAAPADLALPVWDPLDEPFPYTATDIALPALLAELSRKSGIPVIADEGLGGSLGIDNSGGSVRDLLDRLEDDGRILWWWDGGAVHAEPPGSMTSALVPLQGVPADEFMAQVDGMGFDSVRYPILADRTGRMVRVVAPQGYADALRELADGLAASRTAAVAPEAAPPALPTIIRGRSGWWTEGTGVTRAPYPVPAPAPAAAPYPGQPAIAPVAGARTIPDPRNP